MTNLNISKNIKKNVQTRFHGTHITCHINFKLLYEFSVTLILNYYISLEHYFFFFFFFPNIRVYLVDYYRYCNVIVILMV